MPGLQQLEGLAVDAEQVPRQVGGQALQDAPADDLFCRQAGSLVVAAGAAKRGTAGAKGRRNVGLLRASRPARSRR
jgi:hypothetical protein